MSEAPESIYTCDHLGEYGHYYPEAVEAEGEHGGKSVEYIRKDVADAMIKAEREKSLREALSKCDLNQPEPWGVATTIIPHYCTAEVIRRKILALISEDKTDELD